MFLTSHHFPVFPLESLITTSEEILNCVRWEAGLSRIPLNNIWNLQRTQSGRSAKNLAKTKALGPEKRSHHAPLRILQQLLVILKNNKTKK